MDRIVGLDHLGGWSRDESIIRSERLRQRRAASERACTRAGLLHRCRPVPPGRTCCASGG